MAKACAKPFYCVAENHKFVRFYPLNQDDLPKMSSARLFQGEEPGEPANSLPSPMTDDSYQSFYQPGHPTIDYTPPNYISLLFTDVGILTPSAVSDELIKLYDVI